jgi:hypothetical protein
MKTKLIIPFLIVVCFACGKNNGSLSDPQKEKIISEVKPVVNEILKAAEDVNMEIIKQSGFDSPDYTYISFGKVYSYTDVIEGFKSVFATMSNQKMTVASEKYVVLDKSTVLYTLAARWEMNFKDGHSVIQEPWVSQFMLKKMDGKWKVVSVSESGFERPDKVSKEPKELNQVELAKQFLGKWKCEFNDSVFISDQKIYGKTGQECVYTLSSKGKLLDEGRQLVGYDPRTDRLVATSVSKNMKFWMSSLRFTSKDKYTAVSDADIYHPESAAFHVEGEFTPGKLVEKYIKDGKVIQTYTYTKMK